ncbi:hypothetical protein ACFLSG_03595 [Candidatus Bipolaricaulota bacterium]
MKLVALLVAGLAVFSAASIAGEYFSNDTMAVVHGLQVVFSEPVSLESFGDALMDVEPLGESIEFIFSGGELAPWEGQWVNWRPATAKVVSHRWLSEGETLSREPLDSTAAEFTYEVRSEDLEVNLVITRSIERNRIPFAVRYEVATPQSLEGFLMSWDVDKYVDSDGDGDLQNDHDHEGVVLDLVYAENYNPTLTLNVFSGTGERALSWENMVRNDFTAGDTVILDGNKLLQSHGHAVSQASSLAWQQMHMEQNSLEYMTEYMVDALNLHSSMSSFTPQYAGRYVYSLQTSVAGDLVSLQVAGWVIERPTGSAADLVVIMADVWNDVFDDENNRIEGGGVWFSDEEAIEKLEYLADSGFESIALNSAIILERTLPVPLLTSEEVNNPSDDDLRRSLSKIESPYLDVGSYFSLLAEPQWGANDAWVKFDSLPQAYFEEFFRQYRERILELADIAEEFGVVGMIVGANHPYLWGIGGIDDANHSTGRYVANQWIEMISDVRDVFSGEVGITAIHPNISVAQSFARIPDYVEYLTGSYCYWGNCTHADRIAATRNAEELRAALVAFYRDAVEPIARDMQAPVAFQLGARSFRGAARLYNAPTHEGDAYAAWRPEFASGGYGDEILNGDAMAPFQPSFRDQTLLLETFLPVLASMPSVGSIYLWGEYWKLLDFDDFTPATVLEIHVANGVSIQGKPGFQVARLWASILAPNERLLYRRVLPLPVSHDDVPTPDSDEIHSMVPEIAPNWEDIDYTYSYSNATIVPAEYTVGNVERESPDLENWGLEGSDVKGLKVSCLDEGLFVHWEMHSASIDGEYSYSLHLWQNPKVLLLVTANQDEASAYASLMQDGIWESISASIIELNEDSMTIWIPDPEVLCLNSSSLYQWDIIPLLEYDGAKGHEVFELPLERQSGTASSQPLSEVAEGQKTTGVMTYTIARKPHALEEYQGNLIITDLSGEIYVLDPETGDFKAYRSIASQVVDSSILGNSIYIAQEDGVVLPISLTNMEQENSIVDITAGETDGLVLMGIEFSQGKFHALLVDEANGEYSIGVFEIGTGARISSQVVSPSSHGELLSLVEYEGRLYTVDWEQDVIYSLQFNAGTGQYELEHEFRVDEYVPRQLWVQDPRGFCWSSYGWAIVTTGYSGATEGRLHIAIQDDTTDVTP